MRVDNPTAAPCDVQVFTSDGTWVKPPGAVSVNVVLIGGGGGGSRGGHGAAGGDIYGGPGGAGAGWLSMTVPAESIPATMLVGVPPGGLGATGGRSGQPTPGGNGSPTTFGSLFSVPGGYGGGTVPPGGGGTINAGGVAPGAMIKGCDGADSNTSLFPNGRMAGLESGGCPGGASGGGITAAGDRGDGAPGQTSSSTFAPPPGNPGVEGIGDGASGGDGPSFVGDMPLPGCSGGSGAASLTGNGGNGGNGGPYGAAGSGGGAALDPNTPGNGGNGGPGIAVIITYF